jgi:hypothetical protein
MHASPLQLLGAIALVGGALVGCDTLVDLPPGPPPPPVVVPVEPGACDDSSEAPTLAEVQGRYVADIHPLFIRAEGGCLACHGAASGRLMRLPDEGPGSADAAFLRLRTDGYLGRDAGSALARVLDDSMPQGGPAWSAAEKALLDDFTCALARADANGPPLDEQFPPELELPYEGPAITEYDNAFLTYDQLRGRVVTVFDDAWVREGIDRFAENISLFGSVDFLTSFVAARQATPEFLAGLDLLAEDVCARAVADGTGPFADVDLASPIVDEPAPTTTAHEAEGSDVTIVGLPTGCLPGAGATRVVLCTNASLNVDHVFPIAGTYRITARVQADPNPDGPPILAVRIGGESLGEVVVPGTAFVDMVIEGEVAAGEQVVSLAFTNDSVVNGDDRNLIVDRFIIEGPLPGSTAGAPGGEASAKARIATVMERILQRPVDPARADDAVDLAGLHEVLVELEAFDGNRARAWSGVCEALLHHPDFLFTRAGTFDVLADDDPLRERLLATQAALVLLDRSPSADELLRFDVGEVDRAGLVDAWLQDDAFIARYTHRVRQILEYDGTPDGDEPSRLWAFIAREDRPLKEILTADYTVDDDLERVERPAFHGQTGVLTMKGYIVGKPGLPHYNYAARVLTGFMGVVFDVPQEALDARATASATSTVDPQSLCFTCHRLLTPLAHQRQRWADDGSYREVFDDGRVIDDTDNNLVANYPFRGRGLEAFSLVAVRKEAFARRMANAHFLMVTGRLLRHDLDERVVYRGLYDAIAGGEGTLRDLLRAILSSTSVTQPPRPVVDGGTP